MKIPVPSMLHYSATPEQNPFVAFLQSSPAYRNWHSPTALAVAMRRHAGHPIGVQELTWHLMRLAQFGLVEVAYQKRSRRFRVVS